MVTVVWLYVVTTVTCGYSSVVICGYSSYKQFNGPTHYYTMSVVYCRSMSSLYPYMDMETVSSNSSLM